jgi:transcriptional regulator with XRE-family HTH domain
MANAIRKKLTSSVSRLTKFLRSVPTKEAQDAFVAARVASAIGLRIFNMRKKRNWSQERLASEAEMKQARISVLEQADYENFTFSTLRKIASAFGVAVIIDFVSFPDFLRWSDSFSSASIAPESYSESMSRSKEDDASVDAANRLIPAIQAQLAEEIKKRSEVTNQQEAHTSQSVENFLKAFGSAGRVAVDYSNNPRTIRVFPISRAGAGASDEDDQNVLEMAVVGN